MFLYIFTPPLNYEQYTVTNPPKMIMFSIAY